MKISVHFLSRAAFLVGSLSLGGCASTPEVATAPTAIPTPISSPQPAVVAPTPATIIRSNRSSLPTLPQMMGNSPRPTFVPLPTPKVRPGQTIIISNARRAPKPRENPTIIISNAPVPGSNISPQAAAARELVWVNTKTGIYHRPGGRFYGGTVEGFYTTEAQAQARGFRVSMR